MNIEPAQGVPVGAPRHKKPFENPDPVLNSNESAAYIGLANGASLRVGICNGRYPFLKDNTIYNGRRVFFKKSTLDSYLEQRTRKNIEAAARKATI
jgi:hypothetical protein